MKYFIISTFSILVCASCSMRDINRKSTCTVSTEYTPLDDLSKERTDTIFIDPDNKYIFEVIEWNNGKLSFVSAKLVKGLSSDTQVFNLTNYFYSELSGKDFPDDAEASERLISKIFSGALISRRKYERLVISSSCEELVSLSKSLSEPYTPTNGIGCANPEEF